MALFVLSLCPFDTSVGVGAFVIGLSQISSFFSTDTASYSTIAPLRLDGRHWFFETPDFQPCSHFSHPEISDYAWSRVSQKAFIKFILTFCELKIWTYRCTFSFTNFVVSSRLTEILLSFPIIGTLWQPEVTPYLCQHPWVLKMILRQFRSQWSNYEIAIG